MKGLVTMAKLKGEQFLINCKHGKKKGEKAVFVELIFIGIAIAVCILYRKELGTIVTTLVGKASTEITNMFTAIP